MDMNLERAKVFISYSHQDKVYLNRLLVHLSPYRRQNLIDIWVDTRIKPGEDWQDEIENAISRASIAILLITADFLASEFISNNELPQILERQQKYGLKVLSVIVKPCAFEDVPELARFQTINDPNQALIKLNEADSEEVWVRVAKATKDAIPVNITENQANIAQEDNKYVPDRDYVLARLIDNPSLATNYYVYSYHHVDYLIPILNPLNLIEEIDRLKIILANVTRILLQSGWEGDGEIGLIWIPPFLIHGYDTGGFYVWHVKQDNNGTSWIASPKPLNQVDGLELEREGKSSKGSDNWFDDIPF